MMRDSLRHTLNLGAVGALAVWHLGLVGMITAFADRRIIGESLTLSYTLLIGVSALMGYLVSDDADDRTRGVILGGLAGVIPGIGMAVLAVLIDRVNLREVFAAATPDLIEVLTFGKGVDLVGIGTAIGIGALAGAVGGTLLLVPRVWRRILLVSAAVTLLIGLLRDVIAPVLPDAVVDFLYTSGGLSLIGAAVTFLLTAGLLFAHVSIQRSAQDGIDGRSGSSAIRVERMTLRTLGIVILLTFPLWAEIFLSNAADFVGLYIIMALGLNLVVGFAGLLDLGFVAFFAIGAYTVAVMTSPELAEVPLGWWAALPIAILAAIAAGIMLGLPVLRMRGDYLAIATLGFGEIVRILVLSDWLRPWLGGAQGVTRIDEPSIGSLYEIASPRAFYYVILIGIAIAWFLSVRLRDSKIGRGWMAIREDEDVAQAMGINRVANKLLAFALGAAMGGMSGAIFASMVGSVVPASFSLLVSINVLAIIIVGGMGSMPGIIVGALALVALPELLREFAEYRLLVYGAILVAMMLLRPEGLWPSETREREVEAEASPYQIPPPVDMVATADQVGDR